MELKFVNPGVDYMIEKIMEFQTEKSSKFWSEPLYHFYPQLNKEYALSLPCQEREKYITQVINEVYSEIRNDIEEKQILYSKQWEVYKKQISEALSEAFKVDCFKKFNDMKCNITMNPVAPRYLEEQVFDIFYLNSERGAIGQAIHEIIHFVWFYVWNKKFKDSYNEYESPSMKWILSEMVVESVMRDERLSSINPYFPRENGGCIYPYFFTMQVEGENVLEKLDKMYRTQSIYEFMENSYKYCLEHEDEIRKHIEKSEG